MFNPLNRRQFVKVGALGLGSVYALRQMPSALGKSEEEPHFFVQILMSGGVDVSYTFDARPLSMTADNLQHNVLGKEQLVFLGRNGGRSLRSPLTTILDSYLKDFSVINGIHMTPFDGHEQNASYLMTGNAFGGDVFQPYMNQTNAYALDFVRFGEGNVLFTIANDGKSVHLSGQASQFLSKRIDNLGGFDRRKNPLKQGMENARRISESRPDGFAASAALMADGLGAAPAGSAAFSDFWGKTKGMAIDDPHADVKLAANLMTSLFAKKMTRSVIYAFDTDLNPNISFDIHGATQAQKMPETLTTIYTKIIKIFDTFKSIPYDRTRSLYDMTTFMVTSEFARTNRQYEENVNDGGTDHNQFTNTVLLGGKGVTPGLVIGASDLQSSAEIKDKKVSQAHLQMDPELLRCMGKPFDFKTYKNFEKRSGPYNVKDYLSMSSVVNTVMKVLKVDKEKYFLLERNGDPAPVLQPLVVG